MGIVSERDPESTLNPPPCKLISNRDLFSAATVGGVTIRTGTPAIVSVVKFTEYNLSHFSPISACHFSVSARCCSGVWAESESGFILAIFFCASGLIVVGTGTTRVTCTVPFGESTTGEVSLASSVLAIETEVRNRSRRHRKQYNFTIKVFSLCASENIKQAPRVDFREVVRRTGQVERSALAQWPHDFVGYEFNRPDSVALSRSLGFIKIDNLNQATPAQLRQLQDGLAATEAMQEIRRAELLAKTPSETG
jgi:hypothetical protein